MSSVLYSPIVDSMSALSRASQTVPMDGAIPASTSAVVKEIDVYCDPASELNRIRFNSDHGSQYTSWAWGKRLRDAGLLSSMGTVGDSDNAMMASFWGTMQIELLDRK